MIEANELKQIASEFGTPTFLFDIQEFQARIQSVRKIFGESIDLCFAMKANPFLADAAAQQTDRLEVCSPGELDICIRSKIQPSQIVYSGVNKQPEDIEKAIKYGVHVVTAESLLQLRQIETVAARINRSTDVLLRLNAGSQFGMSREDLLSAIDGRASYPHVNIMGIHYFVGTQRRRTKQQVEELTMLDNLIQTLRESHGFEVQRLEYGPGLAVPYFADEDFSDTLAPAREIASKLHEMAPCVQITVEMGRFFAASCGTYLTRAMDVKQNAGISYCILDGGINHLVYSGQMMGMRVPLITNLSHSDRADDSPNEASRWCLCGSLCTVNDVIAREAELEDLQLNDILAFHNAGAYSVTEGIALFLSRTLPRVVLRHQDDQLQIARDFRESSELNEAL